MSFLAAFMMLAATGCGGDATPEAAPSTETKTVFVTPPTSESTGQSPATPEAPTPAVSPDSQTDGPPVITEEQAGDELGLKDIFKYTDDWEESRFGVSAQEDIRGLGSLVICGADEDYTSLELRLARSFNTLEFAVGQANNSPSSQATLVVEVTGNGEQLDLRRIGFDQIQEFQLPITDINAVIMNFQVERPTSTCDYGDDVIAVVQGLKVS